ncbi:DUF4190 domain-containing protein [Haloglycomyces albus]|uniref:DUF4190 domain-containing protein n=1 Tax=Haloglycomyces albus TaxID=526067 RepID=UPI0004ACAD74|nr:DUF4190 domain-containing protein [Haloglycomyces albus]
MDTKNTPSRNGLGTASLVVGIVGLLVAWIPLMFWLALVLGAVGLFLAWRNFKRIKAQTADNKGMTVTAIVLCLLAVGFGLMQAIAVITTTDDAVETIQDRVSGRDASDNVTLGDIDDDTDAPGRLQVEITVHNDFDDMRDFSVTYGWYDSDEEQIDTTTERFENVDSGDTAQLVSTDFFESDVTPEYVELESARATVSD